jgi:hypothetical protein
MRKIRCSETSGSDSHVTYRHIREERSLQPYRCGNLEAHILHSYL